MHANGELRMSKGKKEVAKIDENTLVNYLTCNWLTVEWYALAIQTSTLPH